MTDMLFTTTPETTAAAAKIEVKEWTERDKYGRTVRHFGERAWRTRVVAVKMPKVYIEKYGKEQSYLVNDWQKPMYIDGVRQDDIATGKITYVATLKKARELADRLVREGVAAGVPARG